MVASPAKTAAGDAVVSCEGGGAQAGGAGAQLVGIGDGGAPQGAGGGGKFGGGKFGGGKFGGGIGGGGIVSDPFGAAKGWSVDRELASDSATSSGSSCAESMN